MLECTEYVTYPVARSADRAPRRDGEDSYRRREDGAGGKEKTAGDDFRPRFSCGLLVETIDHSLTPHFARSGVGRGGPRPTEA